MTPFALQGVTLARVAEMQPFGAMEKTIVEGVS